MMYDSLESCSAIGKPLDCSQPPFQQFETDADVAGYGVLWAFSISLWVTVFCTIGLIVFEGYEYHHNTADNRYREKQSREHKDQWRRLIDSIVISLSDTQIVTGIALSVVAVLGCACTISTYHYNIVCNLVIMSCAVHLASILAVDRYFHNIFLGVTRVIAIIVSLIFAGILLSNRGTHGFPDTAPGDNTAAATNETRLVVPAVCNIVGQDAFLNSTSNVTLTTRNIFNETVSNVTSFASDLFENKALWATATFKEYVFLVIFTIIAAILAATHTHTTNPANNHRMQTSRYLYYVRFSFLIPLCVMAGLAQAQVVSLRNWMNESGWFGEDDGEQNIDSFGQYVPLILLILPLLAALEAWVDKNEASKRRGSKRDYPQGGEQGQPLYNRMRAQGSDGAIKSNYTYSSYP